MTFVCCQSPDDKGYTVAQLHPIRQVSGPLIASQFDEGGFWAGPGLDDPKYPPVPVIRFAPKQFNEPDDWKWKGKQ